MIDAEKVTRFMEKFAQSDEADSRLVYMHGAEGVVSPFSPIDDHYEWVLIRLGYGYVDSWSIEDDVIHLQVRSLNRRVCLSIPFAAILELSATPLRATPAEPQAPIKERGFLRLVKE